MRFEVHQVLDAIERRLSTDPAVARGVLDLSEVVRYTDLDNTRPANLLRLGMVVDALARHLAEEDVRVYAVAGRGLLSDADLTSNERMRIRSWSDDGLVEVLPDLADRLLEVADLTRLPVLSRGRYEGLRDRYRWLGSEPHRLLAPLPGAGGAALVPRGPAGPGPGRRSAAGGPGGGSGSAASRRSAAAAALMSRLWRCPQRGCVSFGDPSGPGSPGGFGGFGGPGGNLDDTFAHLRGGTGSGQKRRPGSQPPPRLRGGVPVCPRHDARLSDAGPRPAAQAVSVRVDGVLKLRFVVTAGQPVLVGRAPDEPDSVMLGHLLEEEARSWISRRHLRLELRGETLYVTDTSTNGTLVKRGKGQFTLYRDQSHAIGPDDVLELYDGVQIALAGHWSSGGSIQPASVMADAPTIAMRLNIR